MAAVFSVSARFIELLRLSDISNGIVVLRISFRIFSAAEAVTLIASQTIVVSIGVPKWSPSDVYNKTYAPTCPKHRVYYNVSVGLYHPRD